MIVKSCCRWNDHLQNEKHFDELIIPWKNDLWRLTVFLTEHFYQRVIIDLELDDLQEFRLYGIQTLATIRESKWDRKNYVVRFPDIRGEDFKYVEDIIERLKHYNIPYFFNIIVDNFDTLEGLLALQVSDVYIGNELGFSLQEVNRVCQNNPEKEEWNINIRCYPNVAQSCWDYMDSYTTFWIRPEDLVIGYNNLFNVCEFYQYKLDSSKWQNTNPDILYRIYFQQGHWAGKISEIIEHWQGINIDNEYLDGAFTASRTICKKKCNKGYQCYICDAHTTLANQLASLGIVPLQEKERIENE